MTLTIQDIRAAAERLHGHVLDTPCLPSRTLGEMAGCDFSERGLTIH